jgi:predicted exporter
MLAPDDDGWHAIAPLRGIRDAAAIDGAVASLDDPSIRVLDLRTEAATLLAAYRRQALASCAAGLLLIIATLAVGLKSITRAVRVVVPVMLAVFTSGCVLVALRQPLGIVHVVALLLIVGIGVNYAMFVLRANDLPDERWRTVRTLLVVSSTTLCAFAGLSLSSIPVLHAIGATVCIGIVASLAFSVLLLAPAAALPRSAG